MSEEGRLTYEQLAAIVEPYMGLVNHVVRHVVTGETYIVTGVNLRESDLSPLVVYRKMTKTGIAFSRPAEEFVERFNIGSHIDAEEDDDE